MKNALVIAKYNEDISWVKELNDEFDIIIYEKFDSEIGNYSYISSIHPVYMTNFGREASSYLTYIINYYDKLPLYTIFTQGNPFDHCEDFLHKIRDLSGITYKALSNYFACCNMYGLPHHPGLDLKPIYEKLFSTKCPYTFLFVPNAIFAVSKEIIRCRPLSFYHKMFHLLYSDPEAPWVYERIWQFVFNPKIL